MGEQEGCRVWGTRGCEELGQVWVRRRAARCRLTWRSAEEKVSGEGCEGARRRAAFMLLCECPRAWREPLRMAALCRELLLHARA